LKERKWIKGPEMIKSGFLPNDIAALVLRRVNGDEALSNNDVFCELIDNLAIEWKRRHDTRHLRVQAPEGDVSGLLPGGCALSG